MKGSFLKCGSTFVFPGCFERCTLFFSPLVTKPFEGRVCVFSTLLSLPCLAYRSCFIRVELTRTEIISCSRDQTFVTESRRCLPVLPETSDAHFHLSFSPGLALEASGLCPTALSPGASCTHLGIPPSLLEAPPLRLLGPAPFRIICICL